LSEDEIKTCVIIPRSIIAKRMSQDILKINLGRFGDKDNCKLRRATLVIRSRAT
jgi:hypothetical protein